MVKEALGHAVLATTMRYTHRAKRHLKTLVEKPQDERAKLKKLAR